MRKLLIITVLLTLTLAVVPFGGVEEASAVNCVNSFPTEFGTATVGSPVNGSIAEAFSTLRTAPAGPAIARVLAPASFVATGQVCSAGGLSYVQIQYTSGFTDTGIAANTLPVGWALESQTFFDGIYGPGRWLTSTTIITPTPVTPAPSTCQFSQPTAFASGSGTGQIAEAFSTLRTAPSGPAIVRVLAPATFTVLGQTCADGFSWVNIEYTSGITTAGTSAVGLSGWALESQTFFDGTYGPGRWLER
jgi:hypothetical protein